jgi:hypothetical protein
LYGSPHTHTGVVLNEIAHATAKESIQKGEDVQYLIPGRLEELLEDQTDSSSQGMVQRTWKTERKYYHQNSRKPWFHRFRFQRKSIASINRIRSGHYCLKQCLIRFNIVNTEMCECGEAKETINHIVWQCQLFVEFRVKMVEDLMKCKTFPPYCIEDILH